MDIEKKIKEGIEKHFFTDFQISVRGELEMEFSIGRFLSEGAKWFDVASLTKALTSLLLLRLFNQGRMFPNEYFERFMPVPEVNGRQIWHFMSYLSNPRQNYFDYKKLEENWSRGEEAGSFKETLRSKGVGPWVKRCRYDNFSSAWLGMYLESRFKTGLEDLFHAELCNNPKEVRNIKFHPLRKGVDPEYIVPTSQNESLRGIVHDLVSKVHFKEDISIAGIFSNSPTFADIFHRNINFIVKSGLYSIAAQNQLEGTDDKAEPRGLGFDIPLPKRGLGPLCKNPMVFGSFTGCRIIFSEDPRITICLMTNRTFFGHSKESREIFSEFCWDIFREIFRQAKMKG